MPGDRASNCKGMMKAIAVKQDKKGWSVKHKCKKCGHSIWNMLAEDDNWDKVIALSLNPVDPSLL